MLSNAYFLAQFRFDTAENEPAKICKQLLIGIERALRDKGATRHLRTSRTTHTSYYWSLARQRLPLPLEEILTSFLPCSPPCSCLSHSIPRMCHLGYPLLFCLQYHRFCRKHLHSSGTLEEVDIEVVVPYVCACLCDRHCDRLSLTWGIFTRRAGKLERARSRLYHSQCLQKNMRLKALAEIHTIHSFAQLPNLNSFNAKYM